MALQQEELKKEQEELKNEQEELKKEEQKLKQLESSPALFLMELSSDEEEKEDN
jgi:hypothetical protein